MTMTGLNTHYGWALILEGEQKYLLTIEKFHSYLYSLCLKECFAGNDGLMSGTHENHQTMGFFYCDALPGLYDSCFQLFLFGNWRRIYDRDDIRRLIRPMQNI